MRVFGVCVCVCVHAKNAIGAARPENRQCWLGRDEVRVRAAAATVTIRQQNFATTLRSGQKYIGNSKLAHLLCALCPTA